MKVSIYKKPGTSNYGVQLEHGHQKFYFFYSGDEQDCRWYAKMVRRALKAYREDLIKSSQ